MLEDSKGLNSDTKFHKVMNHYTHDERWRAVDEKDRESLFQDHLDDLFNKEKEEARRKK